jgi:tetratricopeptide (TPR) repeat protein
MPEGVKNAELSAVKVAEAGHPQEAVKILSDAIENFPERGSLRNNRAQAYRMLGDADAARLDLDHAITMETAWISTHEDGTNGADWKSHKHVLQQAYTQRAILNQ